MYRNKGYPNGTDRVMHAHGFLSFSQEADVPFQFTILLRVHADIRNALGENNSGFRQHRMVSLFCAPGP